MLESCLPRRRAKRLGLCTAPALAVGLLVLCLYMSATPSLVVANNEMDSLYQGGDTGDLAVFTRDDGLVDNRVTALLRDDRVLWIGTMAGLSRYTLRGRLAGLDWQTFAQEDGMAADAVSDLWSDNAGGLWIAHPDGQLSFYDGMLWTTYDTLTATLNQAYKQIVDTQAEGPLWAIEEAGRIWALAGGTVGYYVGAVWRPYGEDAAIPRGRLVAVWTGNGAWVASENGQIGYFDGANWTTYRDVFDAVQRQYESIVVGGPTGGPLWVVDQEGAVWVRNTSNQGDSRPDVRRFAEGRWTNFGSADGMAPGFVAELRLDEFGRVWARHVADANGQGGGLSLYNGEPSEQIAGANSWTAIIPAFSGNVTDFSPEETGAVWIASYFQPPAGGAPIGGLAFVSLNTWQRFSLEGLGGASVSDVWLDEDDILWVGLASDPRRRLMGGLWRYRPPQGVKPAGWAPVSGLLDGDVRDLWGDDQGHLWVATAGGVDRITLRNRRLVSYTQSVLADRVAGDAVGNVWAVAFGEEGGVWRWDGNAWARHTASEGLSGATYADAFVSSDGPVYLAGDRGLETWDGKEWVTFAALPGRHVKRIWQDKAGDLWLSTEITPGRPFNLSLNQGSKWETVLDENSSREMGSEPLSFLRDGQGLAWLGAASGLYLYEPDGDSRWRSLGPVEGLPAGSVPALYEDASGTVWVAAGEQVYRTEHLSCASGSVAGLPDRETGRDQRTVQGICWDWLVFEPGVGAVNQIASGPDGGVLFAGDSGVAIYDPTIPDLRLDGVTNLATGEASDGKEPVVLTLGHNAVRIDLTTILPELTARHLSYRYRLQGFDSGWRLVPAHALGGKQASVTYAGLSSGVFTFTAAARTATLDSSPQVSLTLLVLSRPPTLFLNSVAVAGRPAERLGEVHSRVGEAVQVWLSSEDDQPRPLTYRYRIEGLGDDWALTTQSAISFTLSSAGTYTFVAVAFDEEGQSSVPIGSQIVVSEQAQPQDSSQLPLEAIAGGLGVLAALFVGSAILLAIRRRRRESW